MGVFLRPPTPYVSHAKIRVKPPVFLMGVPLLEKAQIMATIHSSGCRPHFE